MKPDRLLLPLALVRLEARRAERRAELEAKQEADDATSPTP